MQISGTLHLLHFLDTAGSIILIFLSIMMHFPSQMKTVTQGNPQTMISELCFSCVVPISCKKKKGYKHNFVHYNHLTFIPLMLLIYNNR